MVSAGVISAGLVGVFAFPAYAAPQTEELRFITSGQQQLTAADAEATVQTAVSKASKKPEPVEAVTVTTNDGTQQAAEPQKSNYGGKDLPAGKGAAGLVAAALAQVGDNQDCTAMVERAMRAIGYSVGDLGTLASQWAAYGHIVNSGGYAPGDILVWEGQHVAIYIGNGQAVHGGWNGTTVVAGTTIWGSQSPTSVVRVG